MLAAINTYISHLKEASNITGQVYQDSISLCLKID